MLGDAVVSSRSLADLAVTTTKLANAAVTTEKLANAAVTAEKLADGAVNSAKVADDTLTKEDLAANSVGPSEVEADAIDSGEVADGGLDAEDVGRFSGSVSRDFPSINAGGCSTQLVEPQNGVNISDDVVQITPDAVNENLTFYASNSSFNDNFRIVACNPTPGAIDPGAHDFRYIVFDR